MSRKLNKTREAYIKQLPERAELLKKSARNIVFNFKFFVFGENGGQSFEDWEKEKILSDLNNKLKIFSGKTVKELQEDKTLEVYTEYPKGSLFTCPPALQGTGITWSRLRLTGRRRLIGFFLDGTEQQTTIFYIVFLDKNHEFAPSNR